MVEVSQEKALEIVADARRLKCRDLALVYISARHMAEAQASPEEIVRYIEEHWMERGVC